MIQVFFDHRGAGKSKNLIGLANNEVKNCKGTVVYIDDDKKHMLQLQSQIRLITLDELNVEGADQFYGLLCGIKAKDYDVESIFIDGLSNLLNISNIEQVKQHFCMIEKFSKNFNVNVYTNMHCSDFEVPDFIKKYVS